MRFRPPPFEITDSDNPFANDAMERRPHIEALTRLIGNIEGPCVLALDAQWGLGKTVFLKMWAQHMRNEGIPVAEFNAWETDFSDDPLMALYATLEDHFGKLEDGTARQYKAVLESGLKLVSTLVGSAIPLVSIGPEIVDAVKESAGTLANVRLDRYREARTDIENFKAALQGITKDKPLVICVDELDRCRPNYAIEFLEATKHIYEVDGVFFILAVNLSELANSVSALYGNDFDARAYLRRFVDRSINLPPGDRTRFSQDLLGNTKLREVISPYFGIEPLLNTFVVGAPHVSLRDIEQGIFHLGTVLNGIPRDPRGWILELYEFAIYLVVFRIVAPDIYQRVSSGEVSDLEALQALNRIFNRPDDWWKTRYAEEQRHYPGEEWRHNVQMEVLLIGWSVFTNSESQSSLLDLRRSQAQDEEAQVVRQYAIEIVATADKMWQGPNAKRRFSQITAYAEMMAGDSG